ncbi:hypothetical protein KAS31_03760 [Candidatus Parcubacteria bacterium]|nr:hypothetical protein [Candidatus Parcubacteria bacterium]
MLIAYNHSALTIRNRISIFIDNLLNRREEVRCGYCNNTMQVPKTISLIENKTVCCSQDCAYRFKDKIYEEKSYRIGHIIFYIKIDPSLKDLLKLKDLAIQTGRDCRLELARLGKIETELITMKIID